MIKILVIEDDELIRDNLQEILVAEGFLAITATNGYEGVHLIRKELPNLIICDVMMPEIDGYRVLEYLRKNPSTATTPFIFLTAKTTRADFRRGMELGAHDYLTKPFTREELLAAIKTQLEKYATVERRYSQELQQTEARLNYLIHHDSITNLPNRLALREKFTAILEEFSDSASSEEIQTATRAIIPVFCLGLDRWQRINETLGHDAGDSLLRLTAQRLRSVFTESSSNVVAYLNGNKFVLILGQINQKQEAAAIARELVELIGKPFRLEKQEVFLTASIGITLYPFSSKEISLLLQNAQAAMEYAVAQGGNQYQFYTATLNVGISERLSLEAKLRHALARKELQVYYQPRISLSTGKIIGAEALLRWFCPEQGFIAPQKFIPIAEETGLIVPIGEWVIKTACQHFQRWNADIYNNDLSVAINLSGRQFVKPDIRQAIVRLLLETRLDPEHLELELTESILVKNPPVARQKLNGLKMLGIKIAIDDFGTGYSSLSYLQQFPFDLLKIDRCFIHNLEENAKNAAITKAIINMAHSLNFRVVAEGVETEKELDFLRENNCDQLQGFIFSRPLSAPEFEQLLNEGASLDLSAKG